MRKIIILKLMSYFRSFIQVNLQNLISNYKYLENYVVEGCTLGAAVKANAYGLGVIPIVDTLKNIGCKHFFVNNVDEALEIKHLQPQGCNIYTLTGFTKPEYSEIEQHNFIPVIYNLNQLEFIATQSNPPRFCLKFDTGVKRLGFRMEDIERVKRIVVEPKLAQKLMYVMSHLGSAEDMQNVRNENQLSKFQQIKQQFKGCKFSFAHSAGILLGPKYQENLARPGAYLYGVCSSPSTNNKQKIVASKYAEVIHKYIANEESYISYGSTYKIRNGQKILITRIGYADGYPRAYSNKAYMGYAGKKLPVIGVITMDMTMLDASALTNKEFESANFVEVFGENIKIEDIAKINGTIAYELLTSTGGRFNRKYI